ncbi:hypothetical protein BDQ17DRAFT_1356689 [Cyathus striatus]|nr:hypothetical protein BDQ17DRAFT_1356689 [Cyathus striatus]
MSTTLKLNCYILGDDFRNVFQVALSQNGRVNDLQEIIKAKLTPSAVALELWNASIPISTNLKSTISTVDFVNKESLQPEVELSKIFKNALSTEYVEVVIKCISTDGTIPLQLQRRMVYDSRPKHSSSTISEFRSIQEHLTGYFAYPRPSHRESRLPLTLLDSGFAQFVDDYKSVRPTSEAYDCASKLNSNDPPSKIADLLLQMIAGPRYKDGRYPSILDHYTDDHYLAGYKPTVLISVRNQFSNEETEPTIQGLLAYDAFLDYYNHWRNVSSVHPCFVVTISESLVSISGCALTDRSTMETFCSIPLNYHYLNVEAYDSIARHLKALQLAIKTLRERYKEIGSSASPEFVPPASPPYGFTPFVTRVFPYPTSFTPLTSEKSLSFSYLSELEGRQFLFKGQTENGRSICIKFVRRYGKDVHEWCVRQGFAPELIAFETLPGGWFMVVMEHLDESWVTLSNGTSRYGFKAPVYKAFEDLHRNGMVHGDINDAHIMIKKGANAFALVGFDWAGLAEKVTYPFISTSNDAIGRSEYARYNDPILPQHDIQMLDGLFA